MIFTWLTLLSSIFCLLLGIVVYSINRRAFLNKVFLGTSIFASIYGFSEAMMWQSNNFESALLWSKIGFIWPIFAAMVFHLALVFTKNKLQNTKSLYVLIYLPAFLFSIISLLTNLISMPPTIQYWGYEDLTADTLVNKLSLVWSAGLSVFSFVLCLRYYRLATDRVERTQSKFITLGFGIPIFAYIITNMILPFVNNINIPNLGHIAVLFFSIFCSYAILKYELFTFDAALAAENIISIMPDSLILADMNGKILNINKRTIGFLEYERSELIGQFLSKFCIEQDRLKDFLMELSQKSIVNGSELTFKTKSGIKKHVVLSGSIVKSKTGRSLGITCVIHDITSRKAMEQRLVRTERLASIGELAGMVGHDLRNPLAGIRNAAFFLKKKSVYIANEDCKEMIEIIERCIDHSDKIINDLLDYSREINLNLQKRSLKKTIMDALTFCHLPEDCKIENKIVSDFEIIIDTQKIIRVFVNIMKNGIEAMPNGGTITLDSKQNDGNIEISFSDTGVGIPEEVLQKLFTPLLTTKAQGMGFGLAICKRIIEAHSGKIEVETSQGKGTKFTLIIPTSISGIRNDI